MGGTTILLVEQLLACSARRPRVPSRGVTVGEPKGADARGGEPACAGVDGVTAVAGVARSPHHSGGRDHLA
eukprot:2470287-Prymnesium_polylepis.1